jgi:hypothetical protein
MCRECHDLAPNTDITEIFFDWVRPHNFYTREWEKIQQALRAFGMDHSRRDKLLPVIQSESLKSGLAASWQSTGHNLATDRRLLD